MLITSKAVTVERAIAIKCWDVKFNNVVIERFDTRREARILADQLKYRIEHSKRLRDVAS